MKICLNCGGPTKRNYCSALHCRNVYKKLYYHNTIERVREVKRAESRRNRKTRDTKNKERNRRRDYYANPLRRLLIASKMISKRYNLEFDLDKDYLNQLLAEQNGKCLLTGIEFDTSVKAADSKTLRRPFAASLDRIDCTKGYTKDNVRLVCCIVNIALSDFGDKIFDTMCKAYINNKQKVER